MTAKLNKRILIVDDMDEIHDAYKTILLKKPDIDKNGFDDLVDDLFSEKSESHENHLDFDFDYDIDFAFQGEEAIEKVKQSVADDNPYALIFMDMRMPPGMNGVDTIKEIWKIDTRIETILCTAFSDYNWSATLNIIGITDQFLLIKKPFETAEIKQVALAQILKWNRIHTK